jgi:RNA methyltransferase, TrmH family
MGADRVAEAFADERLVRLEGFHALKHALRFGAEIVAAATDDAAALDALTERLAPDVRERVAAVVEERPLAPLVAKVPHTRVVAVARRPRFDIAELLAPGGAPVVLLEDPRHLGNVGAVVRVAAAAGAAGVVTTGPRDPWDPAALRGSAGLHFALPVGRTDDLGDRPLVVLDPAGDTQRTSSSGTGEPSALPDGALLAFGTERDGVSAELAARADARVRIPMRPGVSSLNLATAVAVVLYSWPSAFSQRSIVQTGRMPTDS